ncbi:MAG: Mobile element protein [uncultured Thermomicrobiales bacterium]|uniref:Mobile element protein n=1 Tax=uncultured Thermomicrobiales bacterium TaxID=1645740 RepID=A0A6J4VLM6_9BACT|nr:MAG: Mobile element protein [uncultured Thermomicrobiales bacterium]
MASADRFKPYAPDVQAVVRLEEALPPDHPVHPFVDLVRSVDLAHFATPPGPKGEKPYHPHALFGILAWGYLHGVRSSRKLARLARQEATFAYLAGGGRPDYRTLARFRRDNAAAFTAVFQETVVLALRLGLARLGHVALDGTKLKANASKHKAMSYGRMQQREAQLKEEIARLVEQAEARDATEDEEYGADSDGYAVAEELARREARLAKIRALRERLEAEQRAEQGLPDGAAPAIADKEQRSFADGDARIMLMKRGAYDYAYNAQAAVDREHGVIVAADLTNVAPDVGHLPGLVARVRALRAVAEIPEAAPTTASADAGYFSADNAAEDGDGLDLLIAAGRDDPAAARSTAGVYPADCFGYDAGRDVWVCPADRPLVRQVTAPGTRGRPSKHRYLADPAECAACPLRARCLKPGEHRRVLVAQRSRPTGAMRFKLRQPDARRRYARRKAIVEPVFGQLKHARGFDTLSLRGLALATGEYLLACLAHNLGKLLRVCPLPAARPAPLAAA